MTVHGKIGVVFCLGILGLLSFSFLEEKNGTPPKVNLSEYGFFVGNIADLTPGNDVLPYEVNAPLFSDYAEKARFIYLPAGKKMVYHPEKAFEFPEESVIIKNFFYWNDARNPELGRRILETRLLIKGPKGWKALEYIWNVAQTDAVLDVAGAMIPITWMDAQGNKQTLQYLAPNLNQCKGCHSFDGQFVPIGISARQLNLGETDENQLLTWKKLAKLSLPDDFNPATAPRLTDYRTEATQQVEAAARAYLDGNCAHCHNPHGPASTSGMFLEYDQKDPERLGVLKPPVAAGRGSGNRRYGIVPGKPKESILVYRMEQDDPGIRMPELGRQLAHVEGISLIKAWISGM